MPTTTDKKLMAAIDETVAPLINDHVAYLANAMFPALPVSRADLHYVFDQYGTQMLDFSASMAPVGHRHPFVTAAITEHMEYYIRTAHCGEHVLRWPIEYARDIAKTFVEEDGEAAPKVLFTEGERDAVITAINIARAASNRSKIAIVDTNVHNWYSGYNYADMSLIDTDEFFLDEYPWDTIGALLISLVHEDGRVLGPKWVQGVVDRAKQNGVPVIIDESQTGFGRFGTMWGQQHHHVDADLTVLGGPVGGGLALGAVVAPAVYFETYEGNVSPQAGSPVACAAGASTLRAINPGVVEHVKETGKVMQDELQGVVDQFSEYIPFAHGAGLWRTIEFQMDGLAEEFEQDCRAHGLLVTVPVGSSITLTPPLIASEQEVKRGVDLVAETLLGWYERDNK